MAVPAMKASTKSMRLQERERLRLRRFIRMLFGIKSDLFWSDIDTSYYNGTDIYTLYDVQTEMHREFTDAECRALRKGFTIHEGGHAYFDQIDDYRDWVIKNISTNPTDWSSCVGYPKRWVQFYGNIMLDGRMENLTGYMLPHLQSYIDFCNYEWRFGIRGSHVGTDKVNDFRDIYSSRALGLTDLEEWLPEPLELIESVQHLIDEARVAPSTVKCMQLTSEIMEATWPTLLTWMEKPDSPFDFIVLDLGDNHHEGDWEQNRNADENAMKVLTAMKENAGESENPDKSTCDEKPDYSNMLNQEQRQLNNDENEAEEESKGYEARKEDVKIDPTKKRPAYSEKVTLKPYTHSNIQKYKQTFQEVKRYVKPLAKTLHEMLEGRKDEVRRNQKRGSVIPSRAWRADTMGETNICKKKKKGTPTRNAFIQIQWDVSGSTSSRFDKRGTVCDEGRRAITLLHEACVEANVPVSTTAFTEYSDTTIFPLKPYETKYTDADKGFIGAMQPLSGNRDTLALQWAIDQVKDREEDIKLVIMLSDGLPCFSKGENEKTMTSIVEKAEKQGVDVLCLFIGEHDRDTIELVRQMYPGRSIIVEQNLVREISKHVKRIIRKRR